MQRSDLRLVRNADLAPRRGPSGLARAWVKAFAPSATVVAIVPAGARALQTLEVELWRAINDTDPERRRAKRAAPARMAAKRSIALPIEDWHTLISGTIPSTEPADAPITAPAALIDALHRTPAATVTRTKWQGWADAGVHDAMLLYDGDHNRARYIVTIDPGTRGHGTPTKRFMRTSRTASARPPPCHFIRLTPSQAHAATA